MSVAFASLVLGLLLLSWSASRSVESVLALAARFNAPAAVLAATVLALGTSLPELLVSVNASVRGDSAIAVGNALGSNLANMGAVLALCVLLRPLRARIAVLRAEAPIMLLVTVVAGLALFDAQLSRSEGFLLLALLGPAIWLLLRSGGEGVEQGTPRGRRRLGHEIAFLLWCFLLLNLGAELLVRSAGQIAREFDVPPFVIGVSLVAAGTSLPELAVALAAVWRNRAGVVIGAVMGSNIFNLLGVMGLSAAIHPWRTDAPLFLLRDYGTMALLSALAALWLAAGRLLRPHAPPTLHRPLGALLLTGYALYLYFFFPMRTRRGRRGGDEQETGT